MGRPLKDMTNKRFGKVRVIRRASAYGETPVKWLCLCDCGVEFATAGGELRGGRVKSCGCARIESVKKALTTHGMSGTRMFKIWSHMIERCTCKTHKQYEHYGGRGITVCDEWKKFENFHEWATENGYKESLTIDRIDNDGNYKPSNCRWADNFTQQNNQRRTTRVEVNGVTMTLSEWALETGIKKTTLESRYYKGVRGSKFIEAPRIYRKS